MEYDETNPLGQEQETATPAPDNREVENADEPTKVVDDLGPEQPEAETAEGEQGEGEGEPGGEEEPVYADATAKVRFDDGTEMTVAELRDSGLRLQDYTRKTQEVSQQRSQLEAERSDFDLYRQASEEEMSARAQLIGINQQIEQYANVDWNAWYDEAPLDAGKGAAQVQALERARSQYEQHLNGLLQKRSQDAQQATAKRLEETHEFARTKIKGWTPEVHRKVEEFATTVGGFSQQDLRNAYSPQVYQMLHLAWVGHQALQRQSAPQKRPESPTQPLQKLPAKGGVSAKKTLAEMTMDEYAEHRRKQGF